MLHAEVLRRVLPTPRAGVAEAVDGATFEVVAGGVFGLPGPNGAGRTVLGDNSASDCGEVVP